MTADAASTRAAHDRHESGPGEGPGSWTFLTNHAQVLLVLQGDPDLRQRDVADVVGITEGAVQRILNELVQAGHLVIERVGRRNHYEVVAEAPLPQPLGAHRTVGELLTGLTVPVARSDALTTASVARSV